MSKSEMYKRKNDCIEFAEILSTIKTKGINLSEFNQGILFQMLKESKNII